MTPTEMILAILLERLAQEQHNTQSFKEVAHLWQDEGGG